MATFMTIPFRIDDSGAVSDTTSKVDIIRQYIACVILTNHKERVMRPTYGSRIGSEIMENSAHVEANIRDELTEALNEWMPQIRVGSISYTNNTLNENESYIDVSYTLADGTDDSVTVTTASIGKR